MRAVFCSTEWFDNIDLIETIISRLPYGSTVVADETTWPGSAALTVAELRGVRRESRPGLGASTVGQADVLYVLVGEGDLGQVLPSLLEANKAGVRVRLFPESGVLPEADEQAVIKSMLAMAAESSVSQSSPNVSSAESSLAP